MVRLQLNNLYLLGRIFIPFIPVSVMQKLSKSIKVCRSYSQ